MKDFELTGEGIAVGYRADDGVLSVNAPALPGRDGDFSGAELGIVASELGTWLTVVLLESTRDLSEVRLSVLVPSGIMRGNEEAITGAAIIVTDSRQSMGTRTMQEYDVRPLSGTMREPGTQPAQ